MTVFTDPKRAGQIVGNDSQTLDIVGVLGGARVSNTIYFSGNFGGGTISVELTPDGVNWFPHVDTINAKNFFTFSSRFLAARITMAGATAPAVDWVVL